MLTSAFFVLFLALAGAGTSLAAASVKLPDWMPQSLAGSQLVKDFEDEIGPSTAGMYYDDDTDWNATAGDFYHQDGTGGSTVTPANYAVTTAAATSFPLCNSKTGPIILVRTVADLQKRVRYPPTTTVRMILQKSISILDPIVMGRNFSCTIFTSAMSGGYYGYSFIFGGNNKPALIVTDAANILLSRVGWSINNHKSAPACGKDVVPTFQRQLHCPSISVYRSYGIQITRAKVQGRIDLIKTAYCRLDALYVRALGTRTESPGVINIANSGIGPELLKGNNIVSNCNVGGLRSQTEVGINLYFGATGNYIVNNYVHDWLLFGISCGFGIHSSGNCMLNIIKNNFVYNAKSILSKGYTDDSGGIYFNLHWLSPGNKLSCNYVEGPGHCYYLDYVTSGVVINGGACIDTDDGLKINNGKENKIKDIIMVRTGTTRGYLSCQNYNVNNCDKDPGTYWEDVRANYFNTPAINKLYPWLQRICTETSYRGVNCNPGGKLSPSAKETARCSGLPTGNSIQWVEIAPDSTKTDVPFRNCDSTQIAKKLNVVSVRTFKKSGRVFNNYGAGDFGVPKTSPLFANKYNFASCPRSRVGPKWLPYNNYLARYNLPAPIWWQRVLNYELVSA